jgi:hypothetical protein
MEADRALQAFELNAAVAAIVDARRKINSAMHRAGTGTQRSDLESLRRTVTSAAGSLSHALACCRRSIYSIGTAEDMAAAKAEVR